MKSHEILALAYLAKTPDRIRVIEDDNTFGAAVLYCDLAKRGLVVIDNEDGMLVTITPSGLAVLGREQGAT